MREGHEEEGRDSCGCLGLGASFLPNTKPDGLPF